MMLTVVLNAQHCIEKARRSYRRWSEYQVLEWEVDEKP
jgi:hypothetical protein